MKRQTPIHDSLRQAREFVSKQNGVIAPLPLSEEELNPELRDHLSLQAYPLESTNSCYLVDYDFPADSERSEFRFFEDGKQRTIQIGYTPTEVGDQQIILPVHYFVVAAVILERRDKELKLWREPIVRQGIPTIRALPKA